MTEKDTLKDWRSWALIIITVIVSAAPRVFYLNYPFMSDEGAYAYVADTINRGGLPYIDAFDHKPPLIYYFFYFAFKFFGHSAASPRILASLFVGAACLLLIIMVHRLTKNLSAALFSSMLLGLASLSGAYIGYCVNTELFILPFLIGGILLLSDEEPQLHFFFIAGLLFGIGCIIKQPIGVIAVCAFFVPWFRLLRRSASWVEALSLFVLGGILPFAGVMLFYYLHGEFATFWEACFVYNFGYMGAVPLSRSLIYLYNAAATILTQDPVTWFAGVAGLTLVFRSSMPTERKAHLLLITLGSIIAVSMGRAFRNYYFVMILPTLSLAAGLGFAILLKRWQNCYVRTGAVLLVCISCYSVYRLMPAYDLDFKKWRDYGTTYRTNLVARSMGDYLRTHAAPGASLFIVGSEPSIFFYSGLRSASRIYYFWPLLKETQIKEKLQREVLSGLVMRPPDFVVIVNVQTSMGVETTEGNMYIDKIFAIFAPYKLIGVIGDDSESLFVGSSEEMRTIAGKGATMLLLGRADDTLKGLSFGELLGGRGL